MKPKTKFQLLLRQIRLYIIDIKILRLRRKVLDIINDEINESKNDFVITNLTPLFNACTELEKFEDNLTYLHNNITEEINK